MRKLIAVAASCMTLAACEQSPREKEIIRSANEHLENIDKKVRKIAAIDRKSSEPAHYTAMACIVREMALINRQKDFQDIGQKDTRVPNDIDRICKRFEKTV